MNDLQIQSDMQILAGRLTHRGANTENERTAAEYIRDRFLQHTPDAEIDDFYSMDTPWLLFASYYAEFTLVSLVAIWWPRVALCYGAAVLLAYLAEFTGYRVMSRFMPQYETQNVVGRFLAAEPRRVVVVMAHYDSGKVGPLDVPSLERWRPVAYRLCVVCMVLVLTTCATQALGLFHERAFPVDTSVRWCAVAYLLAMAGAVAYNALAGEYSRGANDNASGVAVLLGLARRLGENPLAEADVHLVATGSNYSWMSGARQFLATHKLDRATTFFLNVDRVGRGALCYTTGEGMLVVSPCSAKMTAAAAAAAPLFGVASCRRRTACSDALIPLARGYPALGITARDEGPGAHTAEPTSDSLAGVDYAIIARAIDFAEAVLRRVGKDA
jgi:hypothetical protein